MTYDRTTLIKQNKNSVNESNNFHTGEKLGINKIMTRDYLFKSPHFMGTDHYKILSGRPFYIMIEERLLFVNACHNQGRWPTYCKALEANDIEGASKVSQLNCG